MLGGSFDPTGITYEVSGEYGQPIACAPGGTVLCMQAAATLLLGDSVFLSGQNATAYNFGTNTGYTTYWAAPQVNKSTTLANYTASRIGVVVGGELIGETTGRMIVNAPNTVQTVTCANVNQIVYVMTQGIAWANVDGAVAVGAKLTASAGTAGKLSTTGQAAGNLIAIALNSTAGAATTLVLINLA